MSQLDLFAAAPEALRVPIMDARAPVVAVDESEPATLREHLTSYASSEDTWASLAIHGATDADLADHIEGNYYVELGTAQTAPRVDYAALVPEVRAMFAIPPEQLDVKTLSAIDLISTAQAQAKRGVWMGSGRSPLHERVNDLIDQRGEELLTAAGWPTHDGAPYINAHTENVTSYLEEIEKYARAPDAAGRKAERAENVKYLVEHWMPLADPAAILDRWELELNQVEASAKARKKPKGAKVAANWEPFELTTARAVVNLLKAEIERRTKGEY